MAEKQIKYQILIDDSKSAKTLSDLEQSAEQLNQELKNLDPRSQDFKNLAKSAQQVDAEIEKINNSIEGIKFEDKIMAWDGATKILGGSVATVVGAVGLLGIESEKLEFLEAQAANAIAFAIGLKDMSEGLSQVSIAFKKSGIAAELFGKVTKRALIATGIGALVVALGTVIAYWEEITELVNGTTKSLEQQTKVINAQISDSELQVELLRMEYENTVLRGEAGVGITEEIKKQLLLQQEQNLLLLEALELELARTKEENASVTTWEKIKIGFAGVLGTSAQIKTIAGAINEESEETDELQNKINESKKRALGLDKQLLLIEQDITKEKAFQEFQERKSVEALDIKPVGLQPFQMDKLKSDVKFEDLLTRERIKQQEDYAQAVLINQQKLDAAREGSLDNLIAIAGAESRVGRALLIAKQVLAAKELIMEEKKTITFATLKASEATVATTAGAAKTAAVGFPANIPLLIAYGIQAAGIIAAVVSAVRGAKSAAKGVGSGGAIPSAPRIPTGGRGAPSTAQVQNADAIQQIDASPCIQSYIIAGDARSALEADAKIRSRRTVVAG